MKEAITFEQAIKARGLDQSQLSWATHISDSSLSNLKHGVYCGELGKIKRLAGGIGGEIVLFPEKEELMVNIEGEVLPLDAAIKKQGLTQKRVLELAELSSGYLKGIYSGISGRMINKLGRISAALNCEIVIMPERKDGFYCILLEGECKKVEIEKTEWEMSYEGYSRACERCGKVMRNVGRSRKYCDKCKKTKDCTRKKKTTEVKRIKEKPKAKHETLEEFIKRVPAGISYGKAVAKEEGRI